MMPFNILFKKLKIKANESINIFQKPYILVIGDTWVKNIFFNAVYPHETLDWFGGVGLNIVNTGVGNYTIKKELEYKLYETFLNNLPKDQKSVLILINIGVNDFKWDDEKVIQNNSFNEEYSSIMIDNIVNHIYKYIIKLNFDFRKHGKEPAVLLVGYDYFQANTVLFPWTRDLVAKLKKTNMSSSDIYKIIFNMIDIFDNKLKEFSNKAVVNTYFIDMRHTLDRLDWLDNSEPDNYGYRKMAFKIADYIKENVPKRFWA